MGLCARASRSRAALTALVHDLSPLHEAEAMMAGRNRKPGRRHPNGQLKTLNHSERPERMQAVALEARQRVYGLTKAQAAQTDVESSFLGRLYAMREISKRQYDTASAYLELCREYDRLHPVRGFTEAGNLDRGAGYDASDGTEEWYLKRFWRVTQKYAACHQALRATQTVDIHAQQITDNVVLKRYEMPAHVASLRIGLNALAKPLDIP